MNLRQQLKEIAQNLISGVDFSPAVQLKAEPEDMQKLFVDKKPLPSEEKTGPLYHGTESKFDNFSLKSLALVGKMTGADTGAIWFSDSKNAAKYFGDRIMKVNLNLNNPLHVSKEEFIKNRQSPSTWAKKAKNDGYDAIIIHDIIDGDTRSTVYGVFDPQNIEVIGRKKQIEEQIKQAQKSSVVAGQEVETKPSEKQMESGNYKKGHIRIHGLDIVIENPKGTTRSGKDRFGKEWETKFKNDYGYINGYKGKDKDEVDVFVDKNLDSEFVYIVNQKVKDSKEFDEHKVILGTNNEKDAKKVYLDNFQKNWLSSQKGGLDGVSMTIDQFKDWLEHGNQRKKVKKIKEGFEKDKADPIIDPVQKQSHSGPPAFGLPPSGKLGEPKLHEEFEHALLFPGKYVCLKKRVSNKFYDWKRDLLSYCVRIKKVEKDGNIVGAYILSKGEETEVFTENDVDWDKTNRLPDAFKHPELYKKQKVKELSAGGAGFVTTGPRNYGAPIGPGGGPGVVEKKKYKILKKDIDDKYVVEILENEKSIYEVTALTESDANEVAKNWLLLRGTSKE